MTSFFLRPCENSSLKIVSTGIYYALALCAAGALVGWLVGPWFAAPMVLLALFCLYFFRDPDREIPSGPVAVSPADGRVVAVKPEGGLNRLSIFLNVFDVHVNRAPIAGRITYSKHHPGTYLDARDPYCHQKNEALTWAFAGERATLVVRQITGAIARRIVPWSKLGATVEKGHRFGMIRFGSRTDVYLPLDAEILVKVGDRVEGCSSVVARLAAPDAGIVPTASFPPLLS